jgi:hypothetical protein
MDCSAIEEEKDDDDDDDDDKNVKLRKLYPMTLFSASYETASLKWRNGSLFIIGRKKKLNIILSAI